LINNNNFIHIVVCYYKKSKMVLSVTMSKRLIIYLLAGLVLAACTDIETDKISEELEFTPSLSLPLGSMFVQYDEPIDLPIDLPDPINSDSVSWEETDTVYFNIESTLAERKYIISMLLQFDIANAYPTEMEVELYFIDNMGRDVYLTPSPIVLEKPGMVDGKVTKIATTDPYPYQIPLSAEQIDALFFAEELVIKGSVKNFVIDNDIQRNFSTYKINTAVGVQAEIDFSVNNK